MPSVSAPSWVVLTSGRNGSARFHPPPKLGRWKCPCPHRKRASRALQLLTERTGWGPASPLIAGEIPVDFAKFEVLETVRNRFRRW